VATGAETTLDQGSESAEMAVRGVSRRYAQAVFELATETNTRDAWLADLTTLAQAGSDPVARAFFEGPNVPQRSKRAAIDQLLPGESRQFARNLAYMLIERQRFEILPEMVEVFRDLLLDAQGIAIADVTTAVELTAAERQMVASQLAGIVGKTIDLRTHVDPAMIGGLVARIGDRLIDASVLSQLRQMRQAMA
jgi:F-type H+-transporting ATPase subunit delta